MDISEYYQWLSKKTSKELGYPANYDFVERVGCGVPSSRTPTGIDVPSNLYPIDRDYKDIPKYMRNVLIVQFAGQAKNSEDRAALAKVSLATYKRHKALAEAWMDCWETYRGGRYRGRQTG